VQAKLFPTRWFLQDDLSNEAAHMYYMQIVNDVSNGTIACPQNTAFQLAALVVQAECGEAADVEQILVYVSQPRIHHRHPYDSSV